MPVFDLIAFDADDTLWQNERLYRAARAQLVSLLSAAANEQTVNEALDATEARNLALYGYGIKSYALSMIETAVQLSSGQISGSQVQQIIGFARSMLTEEIQLLDNVAETLPLLASRYRLMLITKGDLLDQESKLARSGLSPYFQDVEILSHKEKGIYAQILRRHGIQPQRFLMVGNSLRSDILPVLELGGIGIHIPFEITWQHEIADAPVENLSRFHELKNISELPDLLDHLI